MKRPFLHATIALSLLLPGGLLRAAGLPGHAEGSPSRTTATSVPSMMMGNHMQVSVKQPMQPGDAARAARIEAIAKTIVDHYRDPATAVRDGYQPYFDSGRMGAEIHYVNLQYSAQEKSQIDYAHPGALLYKRTPHGLVAVGVMYSAAQNADAAELNARAPLSIAAWHRHVDLCMARAVPLTDQVRHGSPFGFAGSIHTEAACEAAGGKWRPLIFGWMTHVYPNASNPVEVWGGTEMNMGMNMAGKK